MTSKDTQNLPEYVDSRKGIELLGVKENKFFYHVQRGEITVEKGRAKRDNRYRVADILVVKQRILAHKRKPDPVLIDWLYAADVPAGLKLSQRLYPGEVDLAEAAIYQAWRRNNPYLTMAAFSKDRSECYASIQVVPLPESVILDVLGGKREEASIDPDEIRSYDQPGPYTLLVTSATCLPERPALLYQVLYRYIQFWIEQYPTRYIKRVYAQAVSASGMKIVQHFFMSPRLELAYNAFMLDLAYPTPARMIREFKQRLEEIAPLPDDLKWPPPGAKESRPAVAIRPVPDSERRPTRTAQPRPATSERAVLPDGWYSVAAFSELHAVHPNTVKKAVATDRFTAVQRGEWKSGRAIVKEALDELGQRAFIEQYNRHPGFTPCEHCPHGAAWFEVSDPGATPGLWADPSTGPASEDV